MIEAGVATWTDPDWRTAHLAWAEAGLAAAGRRITGPVEQPHLVPWSTAFRLPTDAGPTWSKASGPGVAYEGALLTALAAHGAGGVLTPLAADRDRAWLLLDDGGDTLRSLRADDAGDHDLAAWARVLRAYARLQRTVEPWADELPLVGVPDQRPARLATVLGGLIADDRVWARAAVADRRGRRRVAAALPLVERLGAELGATPVRASVEHGDLHGRNVLVGAAGDWIFDWGDASVAHPFTTLATTLPSVARRTGLAVDGPELSGLRDAYLEAWVDVAPRTELERSAGLAMTLAPIARAAAWERALSGLAPEAMGGFEAETAKTLVAFADGLAGRPPTR